MKLREQATYDLMAVSSMGLRMTPPNRQPIGYENRLFELQTTSAETNVLSISASLGLRTKVLSKFIKDNPFSTIIRADLRARGIEYEGIEVDPGGPWGFRHQINFADSGFGARGPRVYNDRAGEVGRQLNAEDYDLDRIFGQEGCRILHISGLVAAISEQTTRCCLEVARKAKQHGTAISFDLNFRKSFWMGREEELAAAFEEIASISDVLIGNEEDFQLALGITGPEAGGSDIQDKVDGFRGMISKVQARYPGTSVFATTLRQVNSANSHDWGALIFEGSNSYFEPLREIPVIDRIGGGDAFVGGMLYGLIKGWSAQECLKFGWATGAMCVSLLTDYAMPTDEEQIWSIYKGNARIKR